MVYACVPKQPFVSVALIVMLVLLASVGIPESTPALVSVSPVGSVPALTVKVGVPAPPVAVRVWLYEAPTTPEGNVVGVIEMVGQQPPEEQAAFPARLIESTRQPVAAVLQSKPAIQ